MQPGYCCHVYQPLLIWVAYDLETAAVSLAPTFELGPCLYSLALTQVALDLVSSSHGQPLGEDCRRAALSRPELWHARVRRWDDLQSAVRSSPWPSTDAATDAAATAAATAASIATDTAAAAARRNALLLRALAGGAASRSSSASTRRPTRFTSPPPTPRRPGASGACQPASRSRWGPSRGACRPSAKP